MNDYSPEQTRAIETLDRNMAVKAGAGAGKTRVLVERYVRMLKTGAASMDGIVAITFTRKAAREMKERIRERLQGLLGEGDREMAGTWRIAAANLDAAFISTIHSLCSRILREHPAEAGVDPEFILLDDIDTNCLLEESWQDVLDRAAQTEPDWLVRLLAVYSPAQVRQEFFGLFTELLSSGLIGPELEMALRPAGSREQFLTVDGLKTAYERAFFLIPAKGRMSATLERLQRLREDWPAIESRLSRLSTEPAALDELEKAWKGMRAGGELGEAIRSWRSEAEALRGKMADRVTGRLIPDLCTLFTLVAEGVNQAKKARCALTYDDLENRTEALLREWPDICAVYNRRIRFVMVDECQDINERQRKIIYLLAGGEPDELRRNALFVVGDVKQSIYRFRGADNRVFSRVEKDICGSGGEIVELRDNYRSHHGLIAAFNDFFAELMPMPVCDGDESGGLDSMAYMALRGKTGSSGEERLEMWVLDADSLAGVDARDQEASMIAGRIRELVAEGSTQYGDIAVLLRAFSRVEAYETAFAAGGIPYYVAGGRGLGGRQEILDALGLLDFLCNRCNEAALFGLLRSPFFLLSDEALLRLHRSGGQQGIWGGLTEITRVDGLTAAEQQTAARARTLLERWLELRGFLTPEELLREAFDATGFDLFQLTQPLGSRRYANLQKLLAMAGEFARRETKGLAAFLQYARLCLAEEGEAEMDSESGNTVRIMTIHKSKGLEFPIVIVPDLQRRFLVRSRLGVFVRGYGLGLKLSDSQGAMRESGNFRRVAAVDAAMERAEMKRLLYVAMTRAEKGVILSAVAKRGRTAKSMQQATGWLDWAKTMLKLPEEIELWPQEVKLGGASLKIRLGSSEQQDSVASRPDFHTFPLPAGGELPAAIAKKTAILTAPSLRPWVLSPTHLAEFAACPRSYYYSQIVRMPELPEPSVGTEETSDMPAAIGRLAGIAFHRTLELLGEQIPWDLGLARAIEEQTPPEWRSEVAAKLGPWIRRYLNSETFRQIGAAVEERREWAFQYRLLTESDALPAAWLSGQVDRVLFLRDGSLGIVDYKTDWVTPAKVQEKAARYRLQLAGYALGAGAAFGREIHYARLYFARTGEHADLDVSRESLVAARRELQETADFIRRHGQETEYSCCLSHCPYCRFSRICPME